MTYTQENKVRVKVSCDYLYCNVAVKKSCRWCPKHACQVLHCTEPSNCPLHVCHVPYCRDVKRSNTSDFCKNHRCQLCDESKYDCPSHVCANTHCVRLRVEGSPWCELDKCPVKGCKEDRYCKTHVCHDKNCMSLKVGKSHFCAKHKCSMIGCKNESYGCVEHRCAHCSQLAVKGRYCRYDACPDATCVDSRKCAKHVCNSCWDRTRTTDSRFCSYCKCRWCDDHHSCVLHKCIACKKIVYHDEKNKLCTSCVCDVMNCFNKSLHEKKCYLHAQRCIKCDEIAVVRGVYCKRHGRCQICQHKPRLPMQATCGRHHRAVTVELYPPVEEKKRTLKDIVLMIIRDKNQHMRFYKLPSEVLKTIEDYVVLE